MFELDQGRSRPIRFQPAIPPGLPGPPRARHDLTGAESELAWIPHTEPVTTAVVLLVAGDKSGQWDKWYRTAIPRAEQLYDDYLAERGKEMGL
jgi:hypothetical protein